MDKMNNNKKQLVKQLENLIEQIKNTELDLAGHSLKHNYYEGLNKNTYSLSIELMSEEEEKS